MLALVRHQTLASAHGVHPVAAAHKLLLLRSIHSHQWADALRLRPTGRIAAAVHRSHGGVPEHGRLGTIFSVRLPAARASQRSAVHGIRARRSRAGGVDHSHSLTTDEEEAEDDDADYSMDDDSDEDAADVLGGLSDDDPSSGMDTAGTSWGVAGCKLAQDVLEHPTMQGLALYGFQAVPRNKRMVIALDKPDDQYGSPSFEDIQAFHSMFVPRLAADIGQELVDQIELEVSSPGAERAVKVPEELERFKHLPMLASWKLLPDHPDRPAQQQEPKVVTLVNHDAEAQLCAWKLADVKANRGKTGRLSKKQQKQLFEVPIKDMVKLHLYIEV